MSDPTLGDLRRCFEGRIPAVIATADATGCPNVTYLSAVHPVDDERVALSNHFMSKTSRNVAQNPWASLLLIDPLDFSEYRLAIQFERTERRGPVFAKLRADVDHIASLTDMTDVFRLRAADIYRVHRIERVFARPDDRPAGRRSRPSRPQRCPSWPVDSTDAPILTHSSRPQCEV